MPHPLGGGAGAPSSPWKEIVESYFDDFLRFFFPDVHDGIDWSRGHESLDGELQAIVRDAELGRRLADKLCKPSHCPIPAAQKWSNEYARPAKVANKPTGYAL